MGAGEPDAGGDQTLPPGGRRGYYSGGSSDGSRNGRSELWADGRSIAKWPRARPKTVWVGAGGSPSRKGVRGITHGKICYICYVTMCILECRICIVYDNEDIVGLNQWRWGDGKGGGGGGVTTLQYITFRSKYHRRVSCWCSGYNTGFVAQRCQVRIPAATLCRHV